MSEKGTPRVVISKNGPYLVYGDVPLAVQVIDTNAEGESSEWRQGQSFEVKSQYALCRCGKSDDAPFCDGTHARVGFDGTETASRKTYDEQKVLYEGPTFVLEDVRPFCIAARFCDAFRSTWDSMGETDQPDARQRVIHQVTHCPSGRLVLREKASGEAIEPPLEPSIGVVQDPAEHCSGPLWVRGGIRIESQDGASYEVRNRVTLCRCGHSKNKPFCDGTHIDVSYQDGLS